MNEYVVNYVVNDEIRTDFRVRAESLAEARRIAVSDKEMWHHQERINAPLNRIRTLVRRHRPVRNK